MKIRQSDQKIHHGLPRRVKFFTTIIKRDIKGLLTGGVPPEQKAYLDSLKLEYSQLVLVEKENFLKKLGDEVSNPRTGQKKYWRALKKLINKSTATIIPPILHNG